MIRLRRLIGRLTGRGAPSDAEIARELQDHLDLEAESTRARPGGTARDAARRRFGNVATTGEAVHEVWRLPWPEQFGQDVRHGARALARSPVYSVAATLTLSLGIGAAAASYCLVDAIHRPFPFLPQDRLLSIVQRGPRCPDCEEATPAAFVALRDGAHSMTVVATSMWRATVRLGEESEMVDGFHVSPTTFDVISAPFALGHSFAANDDQAAAAPAVVVSYDFWRGRLGGSPGALGATLTLDGKPYTIVGVLAPNVFFPLAGDVYAPLHVGASAASDYGSRYLSLFARMAPGTRVSTAATEARTIGAQLALQSPKTDEGLGLIARPIVRYHTEDVSTLGLISIVAALLVFLAACMSAANLALSRTATRRNELALRTALGVSRWRLARHLLTEALLVSLVAGAIGVLLARIGVDAMRTSLPASFSRFVPGWAHAGVDWRATLFTLGAAIAATLVFAALPAIRASRTDLAAVLSDGGRASAGGVHGTRTRSTLVVIEVSIALVLLTAATLLARSVHNMITGDPGVRRDGVLTMHLSLPATMPDSALRDFYRRLDATFRTVPGITSAGMTSTTPLSNNWWGVRFEVPGRPPVKKDETLSAADQHITPDYLRTAGIRIVAGRAITEADVAGAQRVVVVNQLLANSMWPGANPLARTVVMDSVPWSVVGVAANVYHGGLDEPIRYTVYRSMDQAVQGGGDLAVATSGDPDRMRDAVRRAVARTDPAAAIGDLMTMREMEARHVSAFRMMAGMLAVLATVTIVIATLGLSGLIAYGVAQRRREIGIRIAIGARPRDVLTQIGLGAMRLAAAGVIFGLIGASLFTRLLQFMLYGVTAGDPMTFAATAAGLLAVAVAAALIPAWRASRIDPSIALRD